MTEEYGGCSIVEWDSQTGRYEERFVKRGSSVILNYRNGERVAAQAVGSMQKSSDCSPAKIVHVGAMFDAVAEVSMPASLELVRRDQFFTAYAFDITRHCDPLRGADDACCFFPNLTRGQDILVPGLFPAGEIDTLAIHYISNIHSPEGEETVRNKDVQKAGQHSISVIDLKDRNAWRKAAERLRPDLIIAFFAENQNGVIGEISAEQFAGEMYRHVARVGKVVAPGGALSKRLSYFGVDVLMKHEDAQRLNDVDMPRRIARNLRRYNDSPEVRALG